jgi:hypothetical protein
MAGKAHSANTPVLKRLGYTLSCKTCFCYKKNQKADFPTPNWETCLESPQFQNQTQKQVISK